jgi:hypothetical protein
MRLSSALIMIACFAQAAGAAVTNKDLPFVTLCADKQTTGFDWKNGEWTATTFPPRKYVVEKVLPIADDVCAYEIVGKTKEYEDLLNIGPTFALGCYNIRSPEAIYRPIDTKVCFENWSEEGVLIRVDCSDSYASMSISPEGEFNRSSISAATGGSATDVPRGQLAVAVGTCTLTNQK